MDEEEALAAAMAELGLPSAFGSSQAGHIVMRTSKTSRTVTNISKSKPRSQALSNEPSNENEAPSNIISHVSELTFSPESVQRRPVDVVDTKTDTGNPWTPVWDSHYETTYYYNSVSGASQWEAPDFFSASVIPSSSTLGSAFHEQPLQEERKEDKREKVSEMERVWNEASYSENGWAEAGYSENGSQFFYEQEVNVTETVVHDHDETEVMSTMLEATASVSELSAEFKLVGKGKRAKGKKKKMIAASTEALMMTSAYASADVPEADWCIIAKYWFRRYSLFSRFDEGIRMDTEAWYSVTPEGIAEHQAKRCACDVIVDAFTGCGGNAIQFALTCKRVIAIDIDPKKIELARHNACVYGVESKIEFLVGDFLQLASQLKADVVFLSPPWGGPGYVDVKHYDLDSMLMPCGGAKLFKVAVGVAQDVAIFVPRNSNLLQLEELTWMTQPPLEHDVEENRINERVKGLTAYYGSISQPQDPIPS